MPNRLHTSSHGRDVTEDEELFGCECVDSGLNELGKTFKDTKSYEQKNNNGDKEA